MAAYLSVNPNDMLQYHYTSSNVHCLFSKMHELGLCADEEMAKNLCWTVYETSQEGQQAIQDMTNFLINTCKKFSPDL